MIVTQGFDLMFRLVENGTPDYEPAPEKSVGKLAEQSNRSAAEIVYDMLMENDGLGYVYLPLLKLCRLQFRFTSTQCSAIRTRC